MTFDDVHELIDEYNEAVTGAIAWMHHEAEDPRLVVHAQWRADNASELAARHAARAAHIARQIAAALDPLPAVRKAIAIVDTHDSWIAARVREEFGIPESEGEAQS